MDNPSQNKELNDKLRLCGLLPDYVNDGAEAPSRLNAILGFKVEDRETVGVRVERAKSVERKRRVMVRRAQANARYQKLRVDPEFRRKNVQCSLDHMRRYPIAAKARSLVASHVRRGSLPPASDFKCVDCGEPATDYDHRDYKKPLEVEPTCRACNLRRGPGHPYRTDEGEAAC